MDNTRGKNLTIIKKNEFRLFVNEHINQEDVFLEQYKRAAAMLNEIIGVSDDSKHIWKDHEYENNIIAFCGGRGEGKSSVMTTFVNAVCKYARDQEYGDSKFLEDYRNEHMNNIYLADPVIIDPSAFDDVHNVLDIVLAKIFSNFNEKYTEDNGYADVRAREEMIDQFQKVYKCVSLINNQTKILDDEFDYEGNISKLSKLGESTGLKRELKKLVAGYLEFMEKYHENGNMSKKGYLIIAIDDLDLCSSNAYKMAEQIRKYLIIPQVIIVMAVRIEQLKLCVEEMNLHDFERLAKDKFYPQIDEEVKIMADRYISKLIPIARRIYLPSVQELVDTHITYRESVNGKIIWESGNKEEARQDGSYKLVQPVLDLIFEKTGMRFLPEKNGNSFLLPYNLRDMISLIVMLVDMENPIKDGVIDNVIYYRNIHQFRRYFEKEWVGNLQNQDIAAEMQAMTEMDTDSLHFNTYWWLEKIFKKSERRNDDRDIAVIYEMLDNSIFGNRLNRNKNFYEAVEWFEVFNKNIYDTNEKRYSFGFRILYTIKLNELLRQEKYGGISLLLNGYIWGKRFANILPAVQNIKSDRARFKFDTYEFLLELFRYFNGDIDGVRVSELDPYRALSISADDIEKNIMPWTFLGLLANVCKDETYRGPYSPEGIILYDNFQLVKEVQVSLENYLVGMVNLDMIYEKVNMSKLGIEKKEFETRVKKWKDYNKESIDLASKIVTNVDVLLELKDYCIKNRDYKEASEGERTKKLVEKFFDNIGEFMRNHGFKGNMKKLGYFQYGDSKSEVVDISEIYAKLFEANVLLLQKNEKSTEELVGEFETKLTEASVVRWWKNSYERVASYLVTRTVKNAKRNLDALATNVNHLLSEYNSRLDVDMVDQLVDYYRIIIEIYQRDNEAELLPGLSERYKELMKEMNYIDENYLGH